MSEMNKMSEIEKIEETLAATLAVEECDNCGGWFFPAYVAEIGEAEAEAAFASAPEMFCSCEQGEEVERLCSW